jgi:4-alpha-glucanotransferase
MPGKKDSAPRKAPLRRESGVLLHITSLPGEEGIGTLGPEAVSFIDLLAGLGQKVWQILPIHPTIVGDSPFQGPSVFAGNPNLVSLRALVEKGDLSDGHYRDYLRDWRVFRDACPGRGDRYVEYGFLWERKLGFDRRLPGWETTPLRRAYAGFRAGGGRKRLSAFSAFRRRAASWLDDYARFIALKEHFGFPRLWMEWGEIPADGEIEAEVDFYRWVQFVFDEQASALRKKADTRGVRLVGDLAVYPACDSADVWANRNLFQLDETGRMKNVAAVPPDYFSATGQLWGNPLYDWANRAACPAIFDWWERRMRRELEYFHEVKIDHFRGFESYGTVPAGSENALEAKWVPGPGKPFFDHLRERLGGLPVIAEDLGIITDNVRRLRKRVGCPGMRIFLFVDFKDKKHPYLPENAAKDPNTVFYTGTHDNETFRQKVEVVMKDEERKALDAYLERSSESERNWKAIDVISACKASLVIFPAQDILHLGPEARMNNPSDDRGWWRWRLSPEEYALLAGPAGRHLRSITVARGRS